MRANEFSNYLPENYDPTMIDGGSCSSFVWSNGEFHRVAYQSHIKFISKLAGVERPTEYKAELGFLKEMSRYVAQAGIVRGVFQPGAKSKYSTLTSYLNLEGTPKAIRACFASFKQNYPELTISLDDLYYDVLGPDGVRLDSKHLAGTQIDRKFGRR